MKLAWIADRGLDEHNRHLWPQPVDAANFFILLSNCMMPRPVRYKHREFQMPQCVPKESGMLVDKIELIKSQLRASPGARDDRKHKHREDKCTGDFDAVRLLKNDADRRIKKHKACREIAPMKPLPPRTASLQPE